MAVEQVAGNSALESISSSYSERTVEEDPLGREAFLKLLVAQLQNQDPLNPMEDREFTTQLAQFSQLEQTMNTNDQLEEIANMLSEGSAGDLQDYMGKNILAEVDSIEVSNGEAFGGYYTLGETADITINIYDESGSLVRTMSLGQMEEGSHAVSWDGEDDSGDAVLDGSYKFEVIALDSSGYGKIQTTTSGTVEGIIYSNGKAYLQVGNSFVDPDSILKVEPGDDTSATAPETVVDYLGRNIEAKTGVIDVFRSAISGEQPSYDLEWEDEVKINIYDASGTLVRSMLKGTMDEGVHTVDWDGKDDEGTTVSDGVYSYEILTTGAYADSTIEGEVDGILYRDGVSYLQIGDYLVNPSATVKVS